MQIVEHHHERAGGGEPFHHRSHGPCRIADRRAWGDPPLGEPDERPEIRRQRSSPQTRANASSESLDGRVRFIRRRVHRRARSFGDGFSQRLQRQSLAERETPARQDGERRAFPTELRREAALADPWVAGHDQEA